MIRETGTTLTRTSTRGNFQFGIWIVILLVLCLGARIRWSFQTTGFGAGSISAGLTFSGLRSCEELRWGPSDGTQFATPRECCSDSPRLGFGSRMAIPIE